MTSAHYRREIAALKRVIKEQDRRITALSKGRDKKLEQREIVPARFSSSWVAKHREKLGLSAADYAALVGVSPLTIYNWEKGKTRPRQAQLEAWGEIKHLGKREAWALLEAS